MKRELIKLRKEMKTSKNTEMDIDLYLMPKGERLA